MDAGEGLRRGKEARPKRSSGGGGERQPGKNGKTITSWGPSMADPPPASCSILLRACISVTATPSGDSILLHLYIHLLSIVWKFERLTDFANSPTNYYHHYHHFLLFALSFTSTQKAEIVLCGSLMPVHMDDGRSLESKSQ